MGFYVIAPRGTVVSGPHPGFLAAETRRDNHFADPHFQLMVIVWSPSFERAQDRARYMYGY
jgi:hypothetical protein